MKTIWQRLNSETPKFWKKAMALGATLTAISAALVLAPDNIALSEQVRQVAGYVATAGFVLTAVAKVTTADQALSEK
ncbi:hypothetical protein [Parapedobacter soli]|uniref:hypothetical protein n=1 Tax=Parapedobacter soli TaxID=416955 RepID=UPI0021C690CE|nr:hypothetical protein [Parapedobacter soli]